MSDSRHRRPFRRRASTSLFRGRSFQPAVHRLFSGDSVRVDPETARWLHNSEPATRGDGRSVPFPVGTVALSTSGRLARRTLDLSAQAGFPNPPGSRRLERR